MNEQRQYFDIDGNPVTLHKLCKTEPEWAQSRIELMTKEIESLQWERTLAWEEFETEYRKQDKRIESLQGEHKAMLDLIERGWKCPNNCDDGWIEDSDVLLEYTGPNTNCPDCAERDRLLGVKG